MGDVTTLQLLPTVQLLVFTAAHALKLFLPKPSLRLLHRPTKPELPDELVEEIFPKDEPVALVWASLDSKPWLDVLTGPTFRSRYREFHGAPPCWASSTPEPSASTTTRMTPPHSSFPPQNVMCAFHVRFTEPAHQCLDAWDSRHGRVLLLGENYHCPDVLVVWDPMTGCTRELYGYWAGIEMPIALGVAVLCAVSGCDHRACHAAPFKVVFVSVDSI
nr:uncharacterized protein LOC109783343 [Aegilops tauschii subsp. strangulata]